MFFYNYLKLSERILKEGSRNIGWEEALTMTKQNSKITFKYSQNLNKKQQEMLNIEMSIETKNEANKPCTNVPIIVSERKYRSQE